MLLSAVELLEPTRSPSREDIVEAIGGNLCRCTGYQNIVAAVRARGRADDARQGGRGMTGNVARIPPSRQREKPGRAFRWIGQNMKRVEDPRLLAGQGRYIDDVALPGMLHAAVLRSPHAHARIRSIDVSRARALPGVVAVMTGADVAKVTGAMPCFANPPVEQRCVALDQVRYVGEPVGDRRRREPLHRRGRARADRGRVRGAAGGRRSRGGDRARAAMPCSIRSAGRPTSPCTAGSRSARSRGISPTPTS